jgi:glucose/arabinose dehydrogenase
MPVRALAPVILALLAGLLACVLCAKPSAALPPGFVEERVASVSAPVALDFTPDGRLLVASKSGQLHVFDQNGTALASPVLNISSKVCSNSERGLLGVAVDPNLGKPGNNYVYLYYTYKKHGVCPNHKPANPNNPVNRVSRFRMTGDVASKQSEKVLVNNIPSPNGNHNAGDLKFGKDGKLYMSVGDGGCDYREPAKCQTENDASRDRHVLLGKILRITPDGGIPQSNPYTGDNSARCNVTGRTSSGKNCRETFARGLRNPFRIAFNPAGTSFRINDVGAGTWEEIDRGKAGADYGWNIREGHCKTGSTANCGAPPKGMTNPIFDYNHKTGCRSITGGAFVPNSASWPNRLDNAYLYGDFVCNKIFTLTPKDGGGFKSQLFADAEGDPDLTGLNQGPIAMTFGPHGTEEALYYTTFDNGGEVWRITQV